jgi:hypothetical protein
MFGLKGLNGWSILILQLINNFIQRRNATMLNGEGFSAADLAAVVGNNNDGFGGNNNGAWWLLILLLFANNGWGNGFGNNGCASGGYAT